MVILFISLSICFLCLELLTFWLWSITLTDHFGLRAWSVERNATVLCQENHLLPLQGMESM